MGKDSAVLLRHKGRVQFPRKGPAAAPAEIAAGDEGLPRGAAGDLVDASPDAEPALRVIAVPPAVQQHQRGAAALQLQKPLQPGDPLRHLLRRCVLLRGQQVDRGVQILPVGVQGGAKVHPHLRGDLVELGGALLKNLSLEVSGEIEAAHQQKQQKAGRQRRWKRDMGLSASFHSACLLPKRFSPLRRFCHRQGFPPGDTVPCSSSHSRRKVRTEPLSTWAPQAAPVSSV